MVDEFSQAQVPGEGGRQEQAGIGHQAVVVKEDADTVGIVLWQHLLGAPCFRAGFCSKTIIPDSEEHPLASSRPVPKAVLRWMQCKAARRAGDPSGQGEEPPPEGLGGHHTLAQTDARCPAGDVVGHHLYRQPGGVGGEAARGEMVQPHTVLEVSDGILDLGVAAMVGLQSSISPSRSVMKP